ncbi:hypothetical protein MVEG_04797 [Podila verticillata NRRL 6337]|nr:hypothetical protein MVEG_04797 [Podila verticillata NRRL 6337]
MSGSGIVLEASPEHVAYALLGCFIIFFGLVSLFVKEKLFISEAFVSTAFGIIIGPYALSIFDPSGWEDFDTVTLELTRIVIAVQVMAAGVSLPRAYLVKERMSLFMMIVPLMVLMWATSALLIWGLIPDLDFIEAMVIAACVTPTDPVLSNSVVKGRFAEKHVPPRIRYLLSAESGINDGMGLPFLFLGLYLIKEKSTGTAIAKWFYLVWAYQIMLSVIIGAVIGAAARKAVKGAKNRKLIDKESFLVFSIALALAVAGIVSIIASDDLLACFVAGNIFAWDDWFSNEIAEAHIQETIDMLLNLACFVYIGASIPFSSFADAALQLSVWRLVVLAIAILMLRRLPFVVGMKPVIPALTTYREAAFAGWFGPIGVGAVFFSKVTAAMTHPDHLGESPYNGDRLARVREVVFPVVMFMVLSSVLIHGVTVPLLHLQYKYTRTWSRKREDSNHAVSRLPHINIGDDIVLRPPSMAEGEGEQRTIGYDNQRSIGYDNQRSIGYDHQRSVGFDNQRSIGWDNQRSVNQRSVGYGGTAPYGGFGIAGVPDLSMPSSNNNNTRTLQDVVQEMKAANKNNRNSNLNPNSANINNNNNNNNPSISFNEPDKNTKDTRDANNNKEIIKSMIETHPASQGEGPTDIRSESAASSVSGSSRTAWSGLRPPPAAHARPASSAIKIHEVEREEDNGMVRTVSRDIVEQDDATEQTVRAPSSSSSSSSSSPKPNPLQSLFKQ